MHSLTKNENETVHAQQRTERKLQERKEVRKPGYGAVPFDGSADFFSGRQSSAGTRRKSFADGRGPTEE